MFKGFIALLFSALTASSVSMANSKGGFWEDPETGLQLILLPGPVNATENFVECNRRDWDVFNFNYLSEGEKDRFLSSQLFHSTEKEYYPGEHHGFKEAMIWNSSEIFGSFSGRTVLKMRVFSSESRKRRVSFGYIASTQKMSGICMNQSQQWNQCSTEVNCDSYRDRIKTTTYHFTVTEQGSTEELARARSEARSLNRNLFPVSGDLKCHPAITQCREVRPAEVSF